jgi:hypothetical protein
MKKLNIKTKIISALKHIGVQKTTRIISSGDYPSGKYILANDIIVESGNGLSFSGDVTLNMNGKKITGSDRKNDWDYGILSNGSIKIKSRNRASIIGFRVGIKIYGNKSAVDNIFLTKNRYIGLMIEAKNCLVKNCVIENTGGVDDEPYAIAIQVSESDSTIIFNNTIKNIYRQMNYKGTANGEGLGINLAASSKNCDVHDCTILNNSPKVGTIGIFCGVQGGHNVYNNRINNFFCGIGAVSDAISKIEGNIVEITTPIPESYGIFGPICQIINNTVSENFSTRIESDDLSIKC